MILSNRFPRLPRTLKNIKRVRQAGRRVIGIRHASSIIAKGATIIILLLWRINWLEFYYFDEYPALAQPKSSFARAPPYEEGGNVEGETQRLRFEFVRYHLYDHFDWCILINLMIIPDEKKKFVIIVELKEAEQNNELCPPYLSFPAHFDHIHIQRNVNSERLKFFCIHLPRFPRTIHNSIWIAWDCSMWAWD